MPRRSASAITWATSTGPRPSAPVTTVVTPCISAPRFLRRSRESLGRPSKEWVCGSMKPGATMSPVASIVFPAGSLARAASPTKPMRSPRSPMSARRAGPPEPSYTVPPLTRTSTESARCAGAETSSRSGSSIGWLGMSAGGRSEDGVGNANRGQEIALLPPVHGAPSRSALMLLVEPLLGDLPVLDGVDCDFGHPVPLAGLLLREVHGVPYRELIPVHEGALGLARVDLGVLEPPFVLLPDGVQAGHFGGHTLEIVRLDADDIWGVELTDGVQVASGPTELHQLAGDGFGGGRSCGGHQCLLSWVLGAHSIRLMLPIAPLSENESTTERDRGGGSGNGPPLRPPG